MESESNRLRERMLPSRREVVFSARIEYDQYHGNQKGWSIGDSERQENHVPKLRNEVERVIEERLPADMERIFGLDVKTRVITCRYGSLTVFFGAVVAGFGLIASYKDFFDSVKLIEQHCQFLLGSHLKDRYPHLAFDTGVNINYPRLRDPYDWPHPRHFDLSSKEWTRFFSAPWMRPQPPARRDGFFWFLLILCMLLMAALGVLVYAAVAQTYFPGAVDPPDSQALLSSGSLLLARM